MTKQKKALEQVQKQQTAREEGQQPIIGQQPKGRQDEQHEGQLQQERETGERSEFVRGEER